MTLNDLNGLTADDAKAEFLKCCGSHLWAETMAAARPFASQNDLLMKGDDVCSSLDETEWLEAFRAHPKIGEKKALAAQTAQERNWSSQEQSAMQSAAADIVSQLAERNLEYETKFGFIFIVCASGKSSAEMLSMLNSRMANDRQTELQVAAEEQRKITRLRLQKLLMQ